jgi:ABC-type nitrate/sulfonate/bicarbonate transport system substrate-binding protein
MITRRTVLKGAAVTAGSLAAMPAIIRPSRAAEAMSVVTPLGFSIDFFDTMNAFSGGHYAKFGLDAKVIGANTGVQMTQLVVSGQGTIGRGAPPDIIRAVAAKQPAPISISTIAQGCNFRVFSLKSKPVSEPKDFAGKTVGLITLASPTGIYLDVMLAKAGLKPSDVERQPTGGTPGAVEILKKGRVDCFISTVAVEVALQRAHQEVAVFNPDKYLPLPGQCYYAMNDTIKNRPEVMVRFLKAIHASVEEMLSEPLEPLIRRATKDFDIPGANDIDMLVAMLKAAVNETMLAQGKENLMRNLPQLWAQGCDALRDAHIVEVKDPTVLYTNTFVDEALKT